MNPSAVEFLRSLFRSPVFTEARSLDDLRRLPTGLHQQEEIRSLWDGMPRRERVMIKLLRDRTTEEDDLLEDSDPDSDVAGPGELSSGDAQLVQIGRRILGLQTLKTNAHEQEEEHEGQEKHEKVRTGSSSTAKSTGNRGPGNEVRLSNV